MKKITILEDDEKISNELEKFFTRNGFAVKIELKTENIIEKIINENADMLFIDLNLDELDGLYVCKEIRKISDIPIIIGTGRSNQLDELISINTGADDFIRKPYDLMVLLARIEAIFRRIDRESLDRKILLINELKIDKGLNEIENIKTEMKEKLTQNEYNILLYIIKNRNKIISRKELMYYLWNTEEFIDDNILSVNIARLRKKMDNIGLGGAIVTERGKGYKLKLR